MPRGACAEGAAPVTRISGSSASCNPSRLCERLCERLDSRDRVSENQGRSQALPCDAAATGPQTLATAPRSDLRPKMPDAGSRPMGPPER